MNSTRMTSLEMENTMSDKLFIKTAIKVISIFTFFILFQIYIEIRKRERSAIPLISLSRQLDQRNWKNLDMKKQGKSRENKTR